MENNGLIAFAFAPYACLRLPKEGGDSLLASLSLLLASVGASLGKKVDEIEGARWVLPLEASALLDEAFPCPKELDESGRRALLFGIPIEWVSQPPCA